MVSHSLSFNLSPQGELGGDTMFFVNSGALEVSNGCGFKTELGQGDSFGEGALLHPGQARTATVKCLTPVHLIEISKLCFRKYLSQSDERLAFSLKEKDSHRTYKRIVAKILDQKNKIMDVSLRGGDNIFREGDKGNLLYVLKEGKVDVRAQGKKMLSLQPGDMFGEQSLLTGRPRNATAVCISNKCKVSTMSGADFQELLNYCPATRASLHELNLKREAQRAIVLKMKNVAPKFSNLKDAFDSIDVNGSGKLDKEQVRQLLKLMDNSLSEEQIRLVANALEVDEMGTVSFDEVKSCFDGQ